MALNRVQVTDFRCLRRAELELDSAFTLISGPNASGKTSLLEAIYVMSRGRSFRTRQLNPLIRSGAARFLITGDACASGRQIRMGVQGSASGLEARIGAANVATLSELAIIAPVQIIDPEIHHLIEEGPSRRRRFIDWGVFHVEPSFISNWQRYRKVLSQRNAALKAQEDSKLVRAWDEDLIKFGEMITLARQRHVDRLNELVNPMGQRLLGLPVSLAYRTGWLQGMSLADALDQNARSDRDAAATQRGPHRADLVIRAGGAVARDHVSRGQQKLLAACLLIGQVNSFTPHSDVRPTLLFDDPAAELDEEHLRRLIREVADEPVQLIVTSLSPDFGSFGLPGRVLSLSADHVLQ